MSGTIRYYCTGWSARFGNWHAEVIECGDMATAKRRFLCAYPTLKQVKAYPLRDTSANDKTTPAVPNIC